MGRRISNDWAKDHILALGRGESAQFRPSGGSMKGIIESGDLVEVKPLDTNPIIGNVVLVQVGNFTYLHLVKGIRDGQYLIGNNRGGINGWVSRGCRLWDPIFGEWSASVSLFQKPWSNREKRLREQLARGIANEARLNAAAEELQRQLDQAMAVVEATRAYRNAETDGTPRMWRGKALQDLADVLDDALVVLYPEAEGEGNG